MLAADLVGSEHQVFVSLEPGRRKRNLVAGAGGLFRLPCAIGPGAAMEAPLRPSRSPPSGAYQSGLVWRLTEPGAALDEALRLAEQITRNAPLAVWESCPSCTPRPGHDEAELRATAPDAAMSVVVERPTCPRFDRLHREAPAGVDRPLSAARPLAIPERQQIGAPSSRR